MDPVKLLLNCLLLVVVSVSAYSQPPPTCSQPTPPISSCGGACIHCNIDGYASITNHLDLGGIAPRGYCTFIVHHIQYVGFVAGSASLTIEVTVNACSFGTSIEMGIYQTDDCGVFNLVSNCNTDMYPGTHVFTTNQPLNIGCPYYLVFDGNLPADCPFSVRVLSGRTVAPPVSFNGGVTGPLHVCQGEEHDYGVNHNGACYKEWTATNATITSGSMDDDVTVQFNTPGRATLCFTGENLCNPPAEICQDVIVHPNPIEVDVGPFEICEGDVYLYNGRTYTEGRHEIRHTSVYGCDSIEYLQIDEVPDFQGRLDPSVCFPDCYRRGGHEICIPGYNRVIIPSKTPPFCDSIYEILLNSIRIEPRIYSSGNLSCGDTLVSLNTDSSLISGRGFVSYHWTNEFGDRLGDEDSLIVNESGRYCVEIMVEGPDGTICTKTACENVIAIIEDPELELDTSIALCKGDTLPLSQIPVIEKNGYSGNITYHSGPPTPGNQINGYVVVEDSVELWASFSAGECSDELFFKIAASPSPEILVTDTLSYCEGDTINLMDVMVSHTSAFTGQLSFHGGQPFDTSTLIGPNTPVFVGDSLFVKSQIDQCNDVVQVPMEILEVPISDFILSQDTVCLGDTIELFYQGDLSSKLNYQWTWDGAVANNLGDQDYALVFPDTGLYQISVLADNGVCESEPVTSTIYVERPLDPIGINCVQNDSTITFFWDDIFGAKGYSITKLTVGGAGQRVNDTTYEVSGLMNRDSVRIRVEAEGPQSCGNQVVEIYCKAIYCPPREVMIDSVPYICLNNESTPIILSAVVSGAVGQGEYLWSGNGVVDSLMGVFDPQEAGPGIHLIECVYVLEECEWRGNTIIEVRPSPIALFELDSVVCLDSLAYLSFTGIAGAGSQPSFTFDNGMAFPASNFLDREIMWSTPGIKTVSLYLIENGCASDTFTANIIVEEPLAPIEYTCDADKRSISLSIEDQENVNQFDVLIVSGQPFTRTSDTSFYVDQLSPGEEVVFEIRGISSNSCSDLVTTVRCTTDVCPNVQFELQDTLRFCTNEVTGTFLIPYDIVGASTQGQTLWQGQHVVDPQAGEIDLTQLPEGVHEYVVSYSEDICDYSDTVYIVMHLPPVANASSDFTLTCRDSIYEVSGLNDAGLNYQWTGGIKVENGTSAFNQPGQYILSVSDRQTGCQSRDTLEIFEQTDVPVAMTLNVVSVGCDTTNELGSIVVEEVTGGVEPFNYSINGSAFSMQAAYMNLLPGSYTIEVMDANGCLLTQTVEINEGTPISVDLGEDIEIFHGSGVMLQAVTNKPPTVVTWTPDEDLSCTDCLGPRIRPDSTMAVQIVVEDENGCRASDEVRIIVKYKRVFIPNTFSPNGDGLNDILRLYGTDEVEAVEYFTVFDRWGEQVFLKENIDVANTNIGWDGTFNGEILEPAVYVYHLKVRFSDGQSAVRSGSVTLVR